MLTELKQQMLLVVLKILAEMLPDTNCMTINENTGVINVASNPKNCSNGATITVTAKTPSGKSATATIYYEKDLALTHQTYLFHQKMIKHLVNLQHLLLTPIKMLVGILKQQKNHHIVIFIMLTKIKKQHL